MAHSLTNKAKFDEEVHHNQVAAISFTKPRVPYTCQSPPRTGDATYKNKHWLNINIMLWVGGHRQTPLHRDIAA